MTTTSSPAPSPELTPALRAAISSHLPILFTRRSHTPYIPLPHPLPSLSNRLALTLPSSSDSDIANQVAILSHPAVYSQLSGPPFPYTREEATSWNAHLIALWDRCVARWVTGDFSSEVLAESGCPLGVLRLAREEEEQGEGQVIGDLGVCRWRFEELEGEERERAVKENEARKVGDPEVIWAFGFFLSPTYHSQQILTHALRALLTTWFLPPSVLGVKKIRSAAFEGNWASRRVQEKNGMRLLYRDAGEEVRYTHSIPESKGGGEKSVWVLGWEEPSDGSLEGRFEGSRGAASVSE